MLVEPVALSSKITESPSTKLVETPPGTVTQFLVEVSQTLLKLPRQARRLGAPVANVNSMTLSVVLSTMVWTRTPEGKVPATMPAYSAGSPGSVESYEIIGMV